MRIKTYPPHLTTSERAEIAERMRAQIRADGCVPGMLEPDAPWPRDQPPPAPFMRIGERGETVNPVTGERIPPPTTEYHFSGCGKGAFHPAFFVLVVITLAVVCYTWGFMVGRT